MKFFKSFTKLYITVVLLLLLLTLSLNVIYPPLSVVPGGYLYTVAPSFMASIEHLLNQSLIYGLDCRVENIKSKDGELLIGDYDNNGIVGFHIRNLHQPDYTCPECKLITPSLVIQYKNFSPTRIEMVEKSFRSYIALAYVVQALNTKRMIYALSGREI